MPATAINYLDPRALATIGSLELRARLIVEGLMTGMHRSPYQGISIEFAQHRPYTPGDDIRHLDWKVYGRTDKLYLKQYQKETNLDLVLLMDLSGSMAYASEDQIIDTESGRVPWRKYDHAASMAAALAYLGLQQQDRVGLIMFSDRLRGATRMSNTTEHWRGIVDLLTSGRPEPDVTPIEEGTPVAARGSRKTDLARVFDEVLGKVTRRSVLVLLSDLFDEADAIERAFARVNHRRHDLIVLQTLDPAEMEFPYRAASEFRGLEGEGFHDVDPAALRKEYLRLFNEHLDRVEATARRFRFDALRVNTGESLGPPLSHFLARRAAIVNRGGK